jgi:hypothetical protein
MYYVVIPWGEKNAAPIVETTNIQKAAAKSNPGTVCGQGSNYLLASWNAAEQAARWRTILATNGKDGTNGNES